MTQDEKDFEAWWETIVIHPTGLQKHLAEKAFLAARQSRWIPVTKARPNLEDDVLILIPGKHYPMCITAIFHGDSWDINENVGNLTPTHWQPLPEPPPPPLKNIGSSPFEGFVDPSTR